MRRVLRGIALALLGVLALAPPAEADAASCKSPRFSDIGWTDITATTALATRILTGLGYTPKIQALSVPATYQAFKTKNLDIFLGNWMPPQEADRHAYVVGRAIDIVGVNLTGARFTLAVPAYSYAEGLKSFADIAKFRDKLGGKIYGLEPGNDGNRIVAKMIKQDTDGLGGFELVESSEQGMLAQLDKSLRQKEPIVFLGWEPHPMNTKYQIKYLDDPDDNFGPGNGADTVSTIVRGGYAEDCPNVGGFLKNLHFSLAIEDEIMGAILYDGVAAPGAAEAWLKANKPVWSAWLDGVTTLDGDPAAPALSQSLGL